MVSSWWTLHVRAARGERLSDEEQAVYETAVRQLENNYPLTGEEAQLVEARSALAVLEGQHQDLEARRAQLDAEITALESTLNQRARQLLRV